MTRATCDDDRRALASLTAVNGLIARYSVGPGMLRARALFFRPFLATRRLIGILFGSFLLKCSGGAGEIFFLIASSVREWCSEMIIYTYEWSGHRLSGADISRAARSFWRKSPTVVLIRDTLARREFHIVG